MPGLAHEYEARMNADATRTLERLSAPSIRTFEPLGNAFEPLGNAIRMLNQRSRVPPQPPVSTAVSGPAER